MRDFLLNEALKRLATEASTRFSVLVAGGDQIPFDVSAESGDDSAFYSYVPLTSRFVEERAQELRSLPSFGPAREAAVEAGVAVGYLESRGQTVPADPGERAERMLTIFISALWEGSTEFSLDRARLDSALSMLDAEARGADDAEVVIVPVVGLRMSIARLQLPHDVRIVRSDAIEAPIEAMRSEGMGRASWEPQYLAVAEQHEGEGAEEALNQLRELISVMRLFKGGGIGLGPYAFAPTGEGCWRRIATGAPATRPGGYRLSEDEAKELVELASTLEARPDPDSALTWAVGRFEMGCERESALDGLSDHLLALRAVLEGHGPVGASLPMNLLWLDGSEWKVTAIYYLAAFAFLVLVSVIIGDLMALVSAGLSPLAWVQVHNWRFLVTWSTAVIAAVGTATAAFLSTAATDLGQQTVTAVTGQSPTGSAPAHG